MMILVRYFGSRLLGHVSLTSHSVHANVFAGVGKMHVCDSECFAFPYLVFMLYPFDQRIDWRSFRMFLTSLFFSFLFSGDCIATVSQMAVRKWLHIYNMVSIGSHQFGEHRTRETVFVLVSNYALPFRPSHRSNRICPTTDDCSIEN